MVRQAAAHHCICAVEAHAQPVSCLCFVAGLRQESLRLEVAACLLSCRLSRYTDHKEVLLSYVGLPSNVTRTIFKLSRFPMGATGKLDRRYLRDQAGTYTTQDLERGARSTSSKKSSGPSERRFKLIRNVSCSILASARTTTWPIRWSATS